MAEFCQISLLSYMNVILIDYFPILELPEEIQALVVERVAGNSFTDLYGLRASCKTIKALAERSREEGLAFMKLATDEGYERAVIGKLVRPLKWAWGLSHSHEFLAKRDEFISTVVLSFYSCQCVPVMERDWVLWYIENSKGDKMCNRCFWIKELGLFFHELEPMSVIMDTREW
ncbi:hypothetical protein Bca52824_085859 [Brassica carinata]|uniref:F-box domain-containing protein n=1 Tax=Brassica carinata TaxID=52824 RepID=A0A8X7TN78_BRACI|nr:hypothetical protein Bca52824_085859 [Brassica carinata]